MAIGDWPKWQRGEDRVEVFDEVAVGGRFAVVATPHILDGIVGEVVRPNRFGWAAVGDGLSFYQSWLLLEEPGGGTRAIFHEAARGPSASLRTTRRSELTWNWVHALPPTDGQ